MKLKTLNRSNQVVLREYSEKEVRMILIERNSYVLRCVHSWGEDYGGSQCSEEQETVYEEIIPERILVRDGHFCGVAMIAEYDYYNGGSANRLEEVCLLTEGGKVREARVGFFFGNDDHSRWNYRDYSIARRPDEQ